MTKSEKGKREGKPADTTFQETKMAESSTSESSDEDLEEVTKPVKVKRDRAAEKREKAFQKVTELKALELRAQKKEAEAKKKEIKARKKLEDAEMAILKTRQAAQAAEATVAEAMKQALEASRHLTEAASYTADVLKHLQIAEAEAKEAAIEASPQRKGKSAKKRVKGADQEITITERKEKDAKKKVKETDQNDTIDERKDDDPNKVKEIDYDLATTEEREKAAAKKVKEVDKVVVFTDQNEKHAGKKAQEANKNTMAVERKEKDAPKKVSEVNERVADVGQPAAKRPYSAIENDRSYVDTHRGGTVRDGKGTSGWKATNVQGPKIKQENQQQTSSTNTRFVTRTEQRYANANNLEHGRANGQCYATTRNFDKWQSTNVRPRCAVCHRNAVDVLGSRCYDCSYAQSLSRSWSAHRQSY